MHGERREKEREEREARTTPNRSPSAAGLHIREGPKEQERGIKQHQWWWGNFTDREYNLLLLLQSRAGNFPDLCPQPINGGPLLQRQQQKQ